MSLQILSRELEKDNVKLKFILEIFYSSLKNVLHQHF